jgi:prepilin-type N-terminal cleavage/methylation domain-containing protein
MNSIRRSLRDAGFSMVEVLVAGVVLSIALLGYAVAAVGHHRSGAAAAERGVALLTLERFVERMRADTDWTGLYARLRPLSSESRSIRCPSTSA